MKGVRAVILAEGRILLATIVKVNKTRRFGNCCVTRRATNKRTPPNRNDGARQAARRERVKYSNVAWEEDNASRPHVDLPLSLIMTYQHSSLLSLLDCLP